MINFVSHGAVLSASADMLTVLGVRWTVCGPRRAERVCFVGGARYAPC